MADTPIVVFVCEHGAAKSILAAAYFNKLAREKGVNIKAVARGTHPDLELSQKTMAGLFEDGLMPTESAPQKLLPVDMETAQRLITFCDLPAEYLQKMPVERWDAPSVGENYEIARDVIVQRLIRLLTEID